MTIYDLFFFIFSIVYLPYLAIKGKAHKDFTQRFGKLPGIFKEMAASSPIWIHAVSVGEVLAAKNFVESLSGKFPGKMIVLSTTTRTGNEVAKKAIKGDIPKFYFPLDLSFVVKRVTDAVNPSLFVVMETEIWPNLITELSKRNVPIILLNGRISDKSFRGYRKISFFFKDILKKINLFCMQSGEDAERIEKIGAPKEKIKTTGNMKFDIDDIGHLSREETGWTRRSLQIADSDEFLIAGSTHRGEEEIVLKAFSAISKKNGNLRLLIAPRHVDRAGAIKNMVENAGLEAVLVSQLKPDNAIRAENSVFILDTFGELGGLYSLATVVFMGGSLVKRGGHNIVEPAIFGKPIVFGPHMSNFRDMARLFLDNGAAVQVKDRKGLTAALSALLESEDRKVLLSRNAKKLIESNRGATDRNVREVEKILSGGDAV